MKKIFKFLPLFLTKRLIYKSIKINYNLDQHIIFKIAETKDEIFQALTLLQDAYKDEKLANNDDELRATIYHALPTTTIIVAKIHHEVIGTLSHIADSSLGLPLEKVFDLSKLRNQGKKLCEIGSLAIKKRMRNTQNDLSIYYHLIGYILKFSRDIAKDDYLLIASHPRARAFYQAVVPFKFISNEIKEYSFVGSSPAFAQYLNHERLEEELEHRFEPTNKTNKFFELIFYESINNYQFPSENSYGLPQKVLSPEELNELFFIRSSTLKKINNKDKAAIKNTYNLNNYKEVINSLECSEDLSRKHPRYNITLLGHLKRPNIKIRVTDISKDGIKIILSEPFPLQFCDCLQLELKLNNHDSLIIQASKAWQKNNTLGLKILSMSNFDKKKWYNLIDQIETKFKRTA